MLGVSRRCFAYFRGSATTVVQRVVRRATFIATIALLLVPTITFTACKSTGRGATRPRLVVAASTFPASAAVYVADAKRMFQRQGLDVSIKTYGTGRLALDAMLSGDADVALVAQTPIAKSVLDGGEPVVFATICRVDSSNVVISRKDRGVATARDLVGKRVGLLKGTNAEFFLYIYLVTSGIDPQDVDTLPLQTSTLVPALLDGRVDAISAFAPYTFQAVDRLGSEAVVLDAPGLQATYWNAATTRSKAAERSPALQAFLRAIADANAFVASNPSESRRIVAASTRVAEADLERQWKALVGLVGPVAHSVA